MRICLISFANQKAVRVFKLNGNTHIFHPGSLVQIISIFANVQELDLLGTSLDHLNFVRYTKKLKILKLNSVPRVSPWVFGQWIPKLKDLRELYLRNK